MARRDDEPASEGAGGSAHDAGRDARTTEGASAGAEGGSDAADGSHDDEWIPDPDAPPTAEGRTQQAVYEMQRLLLSSLQATGLVGALFFVIDLVRGAGYALTKGFVLGALVATANLWLLSDGILQLARGDKAALRGGIVLIVGFTALVASAAWVVFFARSWTVGFAFGLAIPAVGGLLYARLLGRDESA